MRITATLAVAVAVAVGAVIAGCSSSGPSTPPAAGSPQAAPTAVATAAPKASVGQPVNIKTATGAVVEVAIVKVVDPAAPSNQYLTLPAGERWVGVQFKFLNKGPGEFADAPMYGLGGADAQGQPVQVQADGAIAAGPSIDVLAGLHLAPGDTTLGFIVFHMAKGVKLARVQFAPPGGSTAEWTLG